VSRHLDWDRIVELVGRAVELPPEDRNAWLDRECGDDPALRSEVESLLAAASESPDYLSRLARDLVGPAAHHVLSEERRGKGDEWRGRTIGAYQVLDQIGRGGMATVYLAHDAKHNRKVAIKVLRPELAATLGVERFVREIEIAAQLAHPHILPLFDSGEAEGVLYYVMPYVEGESLRDRLEREQKLPVEEAIRLADQVASALTYAHERGVVHRDIKPENILLTGDQAIVADFGIARAVEAAGGERITGTGLAIGTPAYMSPEQAMGTVEVTASTDVYALGCVVYEMVGGRAPFEGPTPHAVLAKHAVDPVPSLRTVDPSVPLSVERAVARALAKDPADRFPSASAFAEALTTGTVVTRASPRRWRWRALGIAAGVVLLAAGWGLVAILGGSSIERLAVLPLTNLTNDPTQEYLVEGVHEALISELAQLGLSVIARTTMRQYQNTAKPIGEIAEELGAQAVIEGSLFRAGDSLEITARLYRGANEQEIWTGSYDGDLPNVVALYRGFARAIADEIQLNLRPEVAARLSRASPVNPGVYEAYLKGMYYLNQSTEEDFERAMDYFQLAVERNPADPLAYAGLALAYVTLGHGPAPPPDAWQRGRAAAERAVRLDSTLAEGWAALADIKTYFEWDWVNAERAFRRADELNPSLPMNHYHYAWYLIMHGRVEEALAEHRRAQELDPLTPLHTVWLPGIYLYGGRYRQALAEARKVVQAYPNNAVALFVLGTSAAQMGQYDEAIAAHEKMVGINRRWRFALGRTYALVGRTDDARRILEELEAEPPTSWGAIGLADLHTALGNRDEAFRWLNYEPPHGWLPWSRVNPALEPLRQDPRFHELLRRMNLPGPPGG
jgi:TolB-like protein/Flp pilus assembly protein TadD/tRNA A-37 threonylcarbamoyl transferase component Bud32